MYKVKITVRCSNNSEFEEPCYFIRTYAEDDLRFQKRDYFKDKLTFKGVVIELALSSAKWWFKRGWNEVYKIEDLSD